jgi:hypothetical protein
VRAVDDLAAVLTQGTNLQWLQVDEAVGMVRSASRDSLTVGHGHAAVWSSKLQVLGIGAQSTRTVFHQLGEEECSHLVQLIGNMDAPQLRWLRLCRWPNVELPHTLFQATGLLHLAVPWSSRLTQLPQELGNLVNIRWLNLSGCSSLTGLPDTTTNLRRLKFLDLTKCINLELLPNSLGKLQHLEILNLSRCRSLQALPDSITQCPLRAVTLSGCSNIRCLPAGFGQLPLQFFSYTMTLRLPTYTDLNVDVPPEWIDQWESTGKCRHNIQMSTVHHHMHGAASGHYLEYGVMV